MNEVGVAQVKTRIRPQTTLVSVGITQEVFDDKNELHQSIALHSREIESYVKDFFNIFKENLNYSEIKPKSIQNRLFKDLKYKKKLEILNSIIEKLMN